jgi:hypothetical protein
LSRGRLIDPEKFEVRVEEEEAAAGCPLTRVTVRRPFGEAELDKEIRFRSSGGSADEEVVQVARHGGNLTGGGSLHAFFIIGQP